MMPTEVQWEERFSVGHPVLDRQHKNLLGICNGLTASAQLDTPETADKFHELLHELSVYAREHFRVEEALMKQVAYPHLQEHLDEHFGFLEKLADILGQAALGALDKSGTCSFLLNWWHEHVLISDIRYRPFLAASL